MKSWYGYFEILLLASSTCLPLETVCVVFSTTVHLAIYFHLTYTFVVYPYSWSRFSTSTCSYPSGLFWHSVSTGSQQLQLLLFSFSVQRIILQPCHGVGLTINSIDDVFWREFCPHLFLRVSVEDLDCNCQAGKPFHWCSGCVIFHCYQNQTLPWLTEKTFSCLISCSGQII